jgi:hypothetical protein
MNRKQWVLATTLPTVLILMITSHYIPLGTKEYGPCGTHEKFRFSILKANIGDGLSDYRHFNEFESSLKGPVDGQSCSGRSPDTAKLYLW